MGLSTLLGSEDRSVHLIIYSTMHKYAVCAEQSFQGNQATEVESPDKQFLGLVSITPEYHIYACAPHSCRARIPSTSEPFLCLIIFNVLHTGSCTCNMLNLFTTPWGDANCGACLRSWQAREFHPPRGCRRGKSVGMRWPTSRN